MEPAINPTKSELEILQVLWQHGPSTVRFVNDKINEFKAVNYSSTLKLMQIMVDKHILERDINSRSHVFKPLLEEDKTKNTLLNNFLDTAFNGSASSLMMQLLGNHSTSREELEAIRKLLDNIDPNV